MKRSKSKFTQLIFLLLEFLMRLYQKLDPTTVPFQSGKFTLTTCHQKRKLIKFRKLTKYIGKLSSSQLRTWKSSKPSIFYFDLSECLDMENS